MYPCTIHSAKKDFKSKTYFFSVTINRQTNTTKHRYLKIKKKGQKNKYKIKKYEFERKYHQKKRRNEIKHKKKRKPTQKLLKIKRIKKRENIFFEHF